MGQPDTFLAPAFNARTPAGPLRDAAAVDKAVDGLNTDQAEAVRHVLRADDYAILLGMPGTGKTHTVVKLVAALVEAGQSVLLTAFTNNAVDNLLLKLARLEPPVPFVRLGRAASVHADIRPHTIDNRGMDGNGFDGSDRCVRCGTR